MKSNMDDYIDDEQLEPPVAMEVGFSKIIVVDNVPVEPETKYEKLLNVLGKCFSSVGKVKQIYLPQDENKVTKGYVFQINHIY
jgi:hypothetical protein